MTDRQSISFSGIDGYKSYHNNTKLHVIFIEYRRQIILETIFGSGKPWS